MVGPSVGIQKLFRGFRGLREAIDGKHFGKQAMAVQDGFASYEVGRNASADKADFGWGMDNGPSWNGQSAAEWWNG